MKFRFLTTTAILLVGINVGFAQSLDEEYKGQYECLLEPHKQVELAFPVPGVVKSIKVDRGNFVKKGKLLAQLNSDAEQVSIALSKAKLEFAKRKVARSEELLKDEFVSEFNVDEAVTELRLTELELQQATTSLKLRSLTAPISGIVIERSMAPGEFVSEQDMIRIVQLNPLNVEVVVPVEAYGTIVVGMTAIVFPDDPISGEYSATVTIVDQIIDAASGTFGVRLELPNPDLKLPAGLNCRIQFPSA